MTFDRWQLAGAAFFIILAFCVVMLMFRNADPPEPLLEHHVAGQPNPWSDAVLMEEAARDLCVSRMADLMRDVADAKVTRNDRRMLAEVAYDGPVPVEWALAMWRVESTFNPGAVHPDSKAAGAGQMMGATQEMVGGRRAKGNKELAEWSLIHLATLRESQGSWDRALRRYRKGPKEMDGKVARAYARTVAGYAARYRRRLEE